MTKHVCVINWKGGCGKTTIATHLAVALASSGLETGLADYDRQETAKLWEMASHPPRRTFEPLLVSSARRPTSLRSGRNR